MPTFIDVTNQRFGRLVAKKRLTKNGVVYWQCECDCGRIVEVHGGNLRRGITRACGCQRHNPPPNKHGHVGTPAYNSWAGMIQRCTNPANANYANWGGRGIKVCDKWLNFRGFYEDMGDPPDGFTIERIDNSGNYDPGNCKWAARTEQSNNRRNVRRYKYKGKQYTMPQLASLAGIDYFTMRQRVVRYGWSVHRAMTEQL